MCFALCDSQDRWSGQESFNTPNKDVLKWGAGTKKMVPSTAIEGKKSEVLEELLWFNTLGNTGWYQFRQKEEESLFGEDAVHLFMSAEHVWTDFTLTCPESLL